MALEPWLGQAVAMEEWMSHCGGDMGGTGSTGAFATGLDTGLRLVPPTNGVVAVCPWMHLTLCPRCPKKVDLVGLGLDLV